MRIPTLYYNNMHKKPIAPSLRLESKTIINFKNIILFR